MACVIKGGNLLLLNSGEALKTLDPAQFGKWSSYLAMKAAFYDAYVSTLPFFCCVL